MHAKRAMTKKPRTVEKMPLAAELKNADPEKAMAKMRKSGEPEDATHGKSRSTGGTSTSNEWHKAI
jgi:hypothetical protein